MWLQDFYSHGIDFNFINLNKAFKLKYKLLKHFYSGISLSLEKQFVSKWLEKERKEKKEKTQTNQS